MDDLVKLIQMVIATLDDVEVKGKHNLDKLLGSINALENVVQVLREPSAFSAPVEREEENGG